MLMHFIASQSRQSCWQRSLHVTRSAACDTRKPTQKEPFHHRTTFNSRRGREIVQIRFVRACEILSKSSDVLESAFPISYDFKVDFVERQRKHPDRNAAPIISDSANFLCVFQRMLI